jgi:predicted nucleic acid-binding Zn ribbon protein
MNCSNCQNPIQEGEKFCGKCGKTIQNELSLRILWDVLLIVDVILVPIVLFLVFVIGVTATIFNDDGGFFPKEWFSNGVFLAQVCFVLTIASILARFLKKPKIGIPLAAICAVLVLIFFIF